jgi:hypothetical protein
MEQTIPRLTGDIAPFDYAQGRLRQGENPFVPTPTAVTHSLLLPPFFIPRLRIFQVDAPLRE